jgi:ribonucleotide reductase alpha subunit
MSESTAPALTRAPTAGNDPLELTDNARTVLIKRYLRKGPDGKPVETFEEMFHRVARAVAEPDAQFGHDPSGRASGRSLATTERVFYNLLTEMRFMPNSPTFTGAGTPLGQLAACFVLPIADDMGRQFDGIFSTLRVAALIQQTGGGNGFSFSRLRPRGDVVHTSGGQASGPLGFLRVYDKAFGEVSQGGARRGANMAVLRVDHPDILDFIRCKEKEGDITNFNISVGITDAFMRAVEHDEMFDLVNPRDRKVWRTVRAREIFDEIVRHAHHNGEPGVLFLDTANRTNPVPHLYELEATNPCTTGETLVAVADGRGAVSISELADEGRDVPVYCQGPGGVAIRWGRRPRKTRSNVPIFKVALDDGSMIRATADHKFMLRNGTYKPLSELRPGDSLMSFNKYQYVQGDNEDRRYWAVLLNQPDNHVAWAPEHRLFMEFATGKAIRYPGQVVHHKDFNGLNNCWDNLEVMTVAAHDALHRERMLGDSNPMRSRWWEQLSAEEQAKHRQRISDLLSGENNPRYGVALPNDLCGRIKSSVQRFWSEPAHRTEHGQRIRAVMSEEVRAKISAAKTVQRETRKCANPDCDQTFEVTPGSLQRYHNHACSTVAGRETYARESPERCAAVREAQIQLGLALKAERGRLPLKREFMKVAQERGVNPHVGYYWPDYDTFLDAVQHANHRVVSVEFDGNEDVYNITVDEFHNLAYITNPNSVTRTGQARMTGIITANCGEQWLEPYGNCCLGSINLARHVRADGQLDWEKLRESVELSTHFLDNVVTANKYVPAVPELQQAAFNCRRIGLGIMGLGDAMYTAGVRYGSPAGEEFAAQIVEFVRFHSMRTSIELAKERGPFPAIRGSIYDPQHLTWTPPQPLTPYTRDFGQPALDWGEIVRDIQAHGIRNAAQTTIAPTGTIATVAGCESYGCEPVFALAYVRHMVDPEAGGNDGRTGLIYNSPLFEQALIKAGLDEDSRRRIYQAVSVTGSCQNILEVPEDIRQVFVVAGDITPEQHVRMQAAMQAFIDNSISKTINCPPTATEEDVRQVYFLGWKLGCKGLTVYVTGSRKKVVLETHETMKTRELSKLAGSDKEIAPVIAPAPRSRRPVLEGKTYRMETPLGTAFITVNNWDGQPYEVFITVGKGGSDTAAMSEALGRLISLELQTPSPWTPIERVKRIIDQLQGIGGRTSLGFGPNRVSSLPDAVATALSRHLGLVPAREANGNGQAAALDGSIKGDLCPRCGHATFVRMEGCQRCLTPECGYSEC